MVSNLQHQQVLKNCTIPHQTQTLDQSPHRSHLSFRFSVSNDLKYDAERDLQDINAPDIQVHALNKVTITAQLNMAALLMEITFPVQLILKDFPRNSARRV